MSYFSQPLLNQQCEKVQSQLEQKYETRLAALSAEEKLLLIKAATLSDFVLTSIDASPDAIFTLFTDNIVSLEQPNTYKSMLFHQLKEAKDELALHRVLRIFRRVEMVRLATQDALCGLPLQESLTRLSDLADALISGALDWLTEFYREKWGVPTDSEGNEQPMLVYGMGKLGGKELNFSSDIDLIFCYPEAGQTVGARRSLDNQQFFTRLAQKLISALHQITVDGFVYRVDMRLRPFGESGPLVLTFNAMEDYYQEQGRDWERYAMLKARLIGDSKYHGVLSGMLRPFVYRRYIDFSVIESLRQMKMAIAQEVRRKQLSNNIKLGAGGIREIEFIVQVFQLIRGGREKNLQQRNLLTVLPILELAGELDKASRESLENAYLFLRRVENLIQAFGDQQTQTLPDSELDQVRLLEILAFDSWQQFLSEVDDHMSAVHQVFGKIIGEESPNHQSHDKHWQILWQSSWQQEDVIEAFSQYHPDWDSEKAYQFLTGFRNELTKRSIGQRGRQVIEKLLPLILMHHQKASSSLEVLERVCHIVNRISTRTAYLELLYENEGALAHLIRLCSASSWLTEHIAKYPILLDELIDPKLLHNPPALSEYKNELHLHLLRVPEDDLETQMDTLRQFKQVQQLRIAAADIAGVLPLMKVSDHLTAVAEAIIEKVLQIAWQILVTKHGSPLSLSGSESKGVLVLGYGKMGGIELSYSSDLDLVFLHQSDSAEMTDGDKPILATLFYVKLAQKMMHIFNTRMISGMLYELDMRLRPSGNSGLLMVHINTFEDYQKSEAWTWEHQALVRARPVYGSELLREKFAEIRKSILAKKRDLAQLQVDVNEMRDKMRGHLDKSDDVHFDIKQGHGGLVDIEFLVQFLILANSIYNPEICAYPDNIRTLNVLAQNGIITESEKQVLTESYCLLRDEGHKASLQADERKLSQTAFVEERQHVSETYKKYLQS